MDTMFSSTLSTQGNTCLDLLSPEDGVPNVMIMDDAKEMVGGDFRSKCQRAGCYSQEIEPYSPWMNRAERTIRELKHATRHGEEWFTKTSLGLLP
jgi:transposase